MLVSFLVKEIYKPKRSIMKRVIIYARVSTKEQNVDMQTTDLRQYAEARKLNIVREYIDYASGAKSDRENYKKLFDDVRKRRTDIVLVSNVLW
jgi:DNA invertase Pin-like site-specific DNA recombinase